MRKPGQARTPLNLIWEACETGDPKAKSNTWEACTTGSPKQGTRMGKPAGQEARDDTAALALQEETSRHDGTLAELEKKGRHKQQTVEQTLLISRS